MGILVIVGLAICFIALPIILTQHNGPAQPAASRSTTTEEPEQLEPNVIKVSIAGINFRDNIGDYVGRFNAQLVPEPTNKYDPDAIAILHTDGHLLGYIPSGYTFSFHSLLANRFPYPCTGEIFEEPDHFYGFIYIRKP